MAYLMPNLLSCMRVYSTTATVELLTPQST